MAATHEDFFRWVSHSLPPKPSSVEVLGMKLGTSRMCCIADLPFIEQTINPAESVWDNVIGSRLLSRLFQANVFIRPFESNPGMPKAIWDSNGF